MDVGDADVAGVADAGTGLRDGRGLDDVAHSERPQMAGDGGADARVGHDDHGGRLVRAVGDQACGLLEENGHQASWGVADGAGSGRKPGRTVLARSLTSSAQTRPPLGKDHDLVSNNPGKSDTRSIAAKISVCTASIANGRDDTAAPASGRSSGRREGAQRARGRRLAGSRITRRADAFGQRPMGRRPAAGPRAGTADRTRRPDAPPCPAPRRALARRPGGADLDLRWRRAARPDPPK